MASGSSSSSSGRSGQRVWAQKRSFWEREVVGPHAQALPLQCFSLGIHLRA